MVGGIAFLTYNTFFYDENNATWVIPLVVCFSRIGGAMCFNIGYVSVARLFPT